MSVQKVVVVVGQALQPGVGVAEYDLRGDKALPGFEPPAEQVAADAADDAHGVRLVQFDVGAVIPAVHRHHADTRPTGLPGVRRHQHHEGVVVMAGRAPAAAHGLYAVHQPRALGHTLHAVAPMEVQQVPFPAKGDIQAEAGGPVQADGGVPAVAEYRGAGNHVRRFEHAVEQLDLQAGDGVSQRQGQRLRVLPVGKGGGQPGQAVLAPGDLMAHIPQVRAHDARVTDALQRAHPIIAAGCGGIFQRQDIRGNLPAQPVFVAVG